MGGVGFWLVVAILALVWACVVLVAVEAIGSAAATRDRLDREVLAQQAADHGEPSREQIETGAPFFGPRVAYGPVSETPIYDATAAHIATHAAVDLDAEWEQLYRLLGGAS